ncbi:MAG: hypothetical protein L6R42_000119 [Xanthoria sp. 1 TBL-2021]|nr:MAG: hypothetical protein L6R42_000119 [Xanthoria sp. 1 TBL-2021]
MYSAQLGALGIKAYLAVPAIPSIITEWSALIPLVAHLAHYGENNRMVGELALDGHLSVGLFPKLGYLDGLRKLLQDGPDFLDKANAEASYKVWDVNWGSVFTRANGSAISILTEYALRKHRPPIQMPENFRLHSESARENISSAHPAPFPELAATPSFRRHQNLHVISMSRKNHASSIRGAILLLILSRTGKTLYYLVLLGLAVVFCLLGAFGTAAVVLTGLMSKLVCRTLHVERPSGYLMNNEKHDACMLSAVHENAQTWYLYVGDRGVIDWMLNKTMLQIPSANRLQMGYFRLAHVLQLSAMTFVAAQKSIDGVCLLVLLALTYSFQYLFGGYPKARKWLQAEQVSIHGQTFRFSGRTPMIGAVHALSQARNSEWMETLVTPCPRIRAWLNGLNPSLKPMNPQDLGALSSSDRSWVILNIYMATEAEKLIRRELKRGQATESLYVKGDS